MKDELVDRELERERLEGLVEGARHGTSGALVIRGEAGIGKSALLRHALERAAGFARLEAVSVESESEFAYAALADLLRPIAHRLDAVPGPQAAALSGALARSEPTGADRFATAAGVLSLLAASAEDAPLLVVVDDAQWLDSATEAVLRFAARRLGAEGIVMLMAIRDDERPVLQSAGLPELRVGPLSRGAAAALIARGETGRVPDAVASRLYDATAGNPLALIELPAQLSEAQLAGRQPIEDPLHTGRAVELLFCRRIERLPVSVRRALVVAAASFSGRMDVLGRALIELGLDPISLEPAESQGLISVSECQLLWHHPLVRSAVYHGSEPGERRAAHRALAAADPGGDHRAWHMAVAATEPDEGIAAALEEVAAGARRRSAFGSVADALHAAARQTPEDEARARRLLAAGKAAALAGRAPGALEWLDEALGLTADPLLRADILLIRGRTTILRGDPMDANRQLVAAAEDVLDLDSARGARLLIEAGVAHVACGETDAYLVAARRAVAVAESAGGSLIQLAQTFLGEGLVACGDSEEGLALIDANRSFLRQPELWSAAPELVGMAGQCYLWTERFDDAQELIGDMVATARARGAVRALIYPLSVQANIDFRTGRWQASLAKAAESVQFAEDTGELALLCHNLTMLARVEGHLGRGDAARGHAKRSLDLASQLGTNAMVPYAFIALGELELARGRLEEAIAPLEQLQSWKRETGWAEPGLIQAEPSLVEVCAGLGRIDKARVVLAELEHDARRTGRLGSQAAAARCQGLLAADDRFVDDFEKALKLHDRVPVPFERARTELCYGERLRRLRRRTEARERLRSALATFEWLGAAPWAERARGELRASGETAARREPGPADRLTPQELQIASLVAAGATNREVAAQLFLSPKTIEYHLGNIFRKLEASWRDASSRLPRRVVGPTRFVRAFARRHHRAAGRASRAGPGDRRRVDGGWPGTAGCYLDVQRFRLRASIRRRVLGVSLMRPLPDRLSFRHHTKPEGGGGTAYAAPPSVNSRKSGA